MPLSDIDVIKQIIRDKYIERTEVYIGSEPIPYRVTEEVHISVDRLYGLLLPLLQRVSRENAQQLEEELQPCISKAIAHTTPDHTEHITADYLRIDKEYLFDTFDDLLTVRTKEERMNDLTEETILYITKEIKKDS